MVINYDKKKISTFTLGRFNYIVRRYKTVGGVSIRHVCEYIHLNFDSLVNENRSNCALNEILKSDSELLILKQSK